MTEKLFTGTLNHNKNKTKTNYSRDAYQYILLLSIYSKQFSGFYLILNNANIGVFDASNRSALMKGKMALTEDKCRLK